VTAAKTEDPLLQPLSAIAAEEVPPQSSGMPPQQIFGLDGGAKVLGTLEGALRFYCPSKNRQGPQETAPTFNESTLLTWSFLGQGPQNG
jgi:hypothetical protein